MKSVKRKFFKEEIRKTFMLYALTPIIIISFLSYTLLFWLSSRFVEGHNRSYNRKIAEVIGSEFSGYRNEISDVIRSVNMSEVIGGNYDESQIYEKFYNIVNRHSIRSIFYVYDERGEVVVTNSKTVPQYAQNDDIFMWGIFKRMKDNPGETVMLLNRAQLDVNTRTVYSIGASVLDEGGNIIGFVVFDILENELNTIIQSSTGNHAVITDRYNNNLVTSNSALLDSIGKFKPISRDDNQYVHSEPILEGQVYVHTITSLSFIKNFYYLGQLFLIVVFIILSILMTAIARKVSVSKTKSIDELLGSISRVQEGDLNRIVNINSNDEFELLGEYYNEMLLKLNELIEKNKEEAKRTVLAELKHLEAQFNPHFLFNTLEMLKYMIRIDEKSSYKIIVSMANLLRYSINTSLSRVKLCDDIKYIEDYLTIQKFRFGDNFDYSIDLEEASRECMIPKLIIQPIIENSIKYGFETKGYLRVSVRSRIDGEMLLISIRDNGEGMTEARLGELRDLIYNNENTTSHIGLYNVQKRINLMYGAEYGIEISSTEGQGTEIVISLPVHRSEV